MVVYDKHEGSVSSIVVALLSPFSLVGFPQSIRQPAKREHVFPRPAFARDHFLTGAKKPLGERRGQDGGPASLGLHPHGGR